MCSIALIRTHHPGLTGRFGQILVEGLPVVIVDDVVHAGVDELLLLVLKVLRHVVRHKHNASLSVHHKKKPVEGLRGRKCGDMGERAELCADSPSASGGSEEDARDFRPRWESHL